MSQLFDKIFYEIPILFVLYFCFYRQFIKLNFFYCDSDYTYNDKNVIYIC